MKKYYFWKSIKNYKWRSIFLRHLLISFLITAIPLCAVALSITGYYITRTDKSQNKYAKTTHSEVVDTFDRIYSNVYRIYSVLITNSHFKNCLMPNKITSKDFLINETNEVLSTLSSYTDTIDELTSIYIYQPSTNYVLSTRSSGVLNMFHDNVWYKQYVDSEMNDTEFFSKGTNNTSSSYTLVKNIYIDNIHCGAIIFNYNINSIYSSLTSKNPDIINTFILYDNKIIMHNNFEYLGQEFKITSLKNRNNLINQTDYDKYTIVTEIKNSLSSDVKFFTTLILFIIAVFLIGIFISSYFFSTHYYKDILEIMSILNETDEYESGENSDEIQQISQNILSVTKQKKQIEHQLETNLKLLRKSQLYTLQQQINPHFVFNTLNLVVNIDRMNNHGSSTNTSRIILLLSDILRFNFRNPNYIISFQDELENIEKYMELQNIRYQNKFNFICDIPFEFTNSKVLKFMLQPLVENSIMHGILKKKPALGTIKIIAYQEKNILYVLVEDDGIGISPEKLKQLNATLSENGLNNEFVGISNVNQRIKLVFGDEYGLSVFSEPQKTVIKISLPIDEN